MKRIHITTVLVLFSLIILAGCSGKMRHPSYYTLNLPAPPDPPAAENAKATLAIREFSAPAYLRRGRLCLRRRRNRSVSMHTTAGLLIHASL